MKNFEKYEKEISKLVNEGKPLSCAIANMAGIKKSKPCQASEDCGECEKKCIEWMYSEYKEPILNDEEKEIVKAMIYVIHKLGGEVDYVIKNGGINEKDYIMLSYTNRLTKHSDGIATPWFKNDKFKGMKTYKEYKIEELGITCQTQKDS